MWFGFAEIGLDCLFSYIRMALFEGSFPLLIWHSIELMRVRPAQPRESIFAPPPYTEAPLLWSNALVREAER